MRNRTKGATMIKYTELASGATAAKSNELPSAGRPTTESNQFTELVRKAARDGKCSDLPGRPSLVAFEGGRWVARRPPSVLPTQASMTGADRKRSVYVLSLDLGRCPECPTSPPWPPTAAPTATPA